MLAVLNICVPSRFVSCTIALKFWFKWQSPIGYILILPRFLITVAAISQSREILLFFTFSVLLGKNYSNNPNVHRNRGHWYQLLSLKNHYWYLQNSVQAWFFAKYQEHHQLDFWNLCQTCHIATQLLFLVIFMR